LGFLVTFFLVGKSPKCALRLPGVPSGGKVCEFLLTALCLTSVTGGLRFSGRKIPLGWHLIDAPCVRPKALAESWRTARMAISLKRRLRRRLQGFTTTHSPLASVGTASRLQVSDGIGFVNVSEAQVSVKEKFFPRGKAVARPKLLMEDLQGLQMLF
jgi:hypothetical protein